MNTFRMALVVGTVLGNSGAASAPMGSEDIWSKKHITGLPPEIQRDIARIIGACGSSFAAQHLFSTYYQRGKTQLIVLHFENANCERRSLICRSNGCLHQVYTSTGGPFRRLHSSYTEIDVATFHVPKR